MSAATATVTRSSQLAPGSRRSIRPGAHVTAVAGRDVPLWLASAGHHGRRSIAAEAVVLWSHSFGAHAATRCDIRQAEVVLLRSRRLRPRAASEEPEAGLVHLAHECHVRVGRPLHVRLPVPASTGRIRRSRTPGHCHCLLPLPCPASRPAVGRGELREELGEALDDGPGSLEPEVLHLLDQARRLGGAGREWVVARLAHASAILLIPSNCARTASAASCPERTAPSTHPAFRPLSVQSPATARLVKPVRPG